MVTLFDKGQQYDLKRRRKFLVGKQKHPLRHPLRNSIDNKKVSIHDNDLQMWEMDKVVEAGFRKLQNYPKMHSLFPKKKEVYICAK